MPKARVPGYRAKPGASGLYDRAWRKRRAQHLKANPLCAFHLRQGRAVSATIADHVTPHRGDPVLFAGPIESLCKTCHDGPKQELEKSGHVKGADRDGVPLDPSHPWRIAKEKEGRR
jgi:5-methylcytosine-specific restriction protein A